MADYTWYDRVKRERVYELPLPSNWDEVGKMISSSQMALEAQKPGSSRWGDAVKVTSDGDSLFFSFVLEDTQQKPDVNSIDDQEQCK